MRHQSLLHTDATGQRLLHTDEGPTKTINALHWAAAQVKRTKTALSWRELSKHVWGQWEVNYGTFCCTVQIGLDESDKLLVFAETGVVITVVAKAIHSSDISTVLQQNLHSVLTSKLATEDQCSSERSQESRWRGVLKTSGHIRQWYSRTGIENHSYRGIVSGSTKHFT